MPSQTNFVKSQDRHYFNIHLPSILPYDLLLPEYNQKHNKLPMAEGNRQTGSGKFYTQPYKQGRGSAQIFNGAKNNFDPSISAPRNNIYSGLITQQYHAPVNSKISGLSPIMYGGSFAPLQTSQRSPAINNWLPASNIPEPLRIYEYSTGSQIHSRLSDPIRIFPNRGSQQGRLSTDDYKPFRLTGKYFNTFIHPVSNQLRGKAT